MCVHVSYSNYVAALAALLRVCPLWAFVSLVALSRLITYNASKVVQGIGLAPCLDLPYYYLPYKADSLLLWAGFLPSLCMPLIIQALSRIASK